MMPSTVGSAFVFNWMKVSTPLVDQLIWPGAVNAAWSMKVKFWSPATRLVRIHIGEVEEVALRPVQIRDDVRVEIGQADLVNVRPYKHVQPAAAGQGVLAIAAVDDVRSVVADDAIVVEAAGQVDIRRPDGLQNLDLGIEPDVEAHAGQHGVETLAFVLRRAVDVTVFEQKVAGIVDEIGIFASPAAHVIGTPTAIDDVVPGAAEDE